MRKRTKTFRPCKIPRYLKGSVAKDVWRLDLLEYNNHRFKVFAANCKIDSTPPKMNPFSYVNQRKLSTDAERLRRIDKDNKLLLKKISIINRTIGRIDTYNPDAYACNSKWKAHEKVMKKVELKNRAVYERIIKARSTYSRERMMNLWKDTVEKLKLGAKFPLVILKKKCADTIAANEISISYGMEKVAERPLCFLEFQIKDGPKLGRVVIELYHDHVPVTVQNFLNICSGDNKKNLSYKNCTIYRIVPGRFLETGDVTLDTGRGGTSIYGHTFAEEGHKLKHTKAGVLSMVRIKKHSNNSRFCVTFSSMESLDKQNVVFGRIVKGLDNLYKIEGYGRKIGKPLAQVFVSDCGKI